MKILPLCTLVALTACSSTKTQIKHLGPLSEPSKIPAVCKLAGILPDSPAQKAGLRVGDVIESVNGTKPTNGLAVADLIQNSAPEAKLQISGASGTSRTLKASLNNERPRLGASCDLTGWRKNSVSAAGNESMTVFSGPYAFTASGILDKELGFMRVRVTNHSDKPLPVSAALFSITDAHNTPLKILTPQEVVYFMHGEDAVPLINPPESVQPRPENLTVPPDSIARQMAKAHKGKKEWSRSDELYVQANATYLNKESFWPTTLEPGKVADGLIYFLEPKALPIRVEAEVQGAKMAVRFGNPQPSIRRMTQGQLVQFFESQKKATPLRLTLKDGKVFVGRYSSYDGINEIVWFDTPSGILLTTSSFGLKHISYAEEMTPEQDKEEAPAGPLN